jgi:hypothetical protein
MGLDQWMQADPGQKAAFDKSMFDYYRQMQAQGGPALVGPAADYQNIPPTNPSAAPQTPQTPAPEAGGTPRSLGLGLGLNAGQRASWQAAAQSGQGAQWLGEHRNVAQRVQNQVQAGSPQEQKLQQFIATGQAQRPYQKNQQALLEATKRRR